MTLAATFEHPEQLRDEIFFTNATREHFDILHYSTKRMGNVAYNGNGGELSNDNWFPVFVQRGEIKTDLPQARKSWRAIIEKLHTPGVSV